MTVQCLVGPLLWATEWEMSMKAERIRPKDLSLRVDTSSDVMPSVSIFGRIFNRMVPGGGEERPSESVRGLVFCPSVCPSALLLSRRSGELPHAAPGNSLAPSALRLNNYTFDLGDFQSVEQLSRLWSLQRERRSSSNNTNNDVISGVT